MVWWLRSGRYAWSRLRRRLLESRYLNVVLPLASSVDEVRECLEQIEWTPDGIFHLWDCISYPQTTWKKKKDDCDGFSTLACELLTRIPGGGFEPVLVTAVMHPVSKSHTVCAFKQSDGYLSFFDNQYLREGYPDYEQVVEAISQRAERLVCWDVRSHSDFSLKEFHRV